MTANALEERQRKARLLVPLVMIPIAALLFYSLGGGRGTPKTDAAATSGLNTTLPAPQLESQDGVDKLSLYKKADREALELRKRTGDTSGFGPDQDDVAAASQISVSPKGHHAGIVESPFSPGNSTGHVMRLTGRGKDTSSSEAKIAMRLATLQQILAKKGEDTLPKPPSGIDPRQEAAATQQIADLESMMQSANPEAAGTDPQLKQMDGMLEKILDIQHPDRVKEKMDARQSTGKGQIYAVSTQAAGPENDLFESPAALVARRDSTRSDSIGSLTSTGPAIAFYDSDDQGAAASSNVIAAVIHEGKTVLSGSTVKIRLSQDLYVQGRLIAKGNFVFGKCNITGDRLLITVSTIFFEGSLFTVALTVYDNNGMIGLPLDAGMETQAAKEGSDQAIQALGIGTMDQSLGAQATAAGIEAAKKLLSRKVKLVKVTLKADHPILLVDSKQLN